MEFRRARKVRSPVSIAPLVDIVFLLLIFFLLSSSFQNPAIKLALPAASNRTNVDRQPVTVSLDSRRNLFVNQQPVAPENFVAVLRSAMARSGSWDVIFRGDKSIPYESVIRIVSLAKKAGARHINLSHRYVP